jgi:hypothetical protein
MERQLTLRNMIDFEMNKSFNLYMNNPTRFPSNWNFPNFFPSNVFEIKKPNPQDKHRYIDCSKQKQNEFLSKSGKINKIRKPLENSSRRMGSLPNSQKICISSFKTPVKSKKNKSFNIIEMNTPKVSEVSLVKDDKKLSMFKSPRGNHIGTFLNKLKMN